MLKWLVMCFALIAAPAWAQFIAEDVEVNTAAGPIVIIDSSDGFSRVLQVGKQRFFTDGNYRFVSVEAQRGSLYLIGLSSGGSGCPSLYVWLHTQDGPRISPEFGNCAPLSEVRSDAETVSVVMPSQTAADGLVAFVYDGRTIQEVILGQEATGVPKQADQLIGRYPFELLRDADWRPELVALMGEDGYRRAGDVIATSSQFEAQGDWVAATGFNNRLSGDAYGAIAIHRTDGRVVVALRTSTNGLELWGDMSGSVPEAIMLVMNSG